jgi:endonuclease YncB( thermonuclease family)
MGRAWGSNKTPIVGEALSSFVACKNHNINNLNKVVNMAGMQSRRWWWPVWGCWLACMLVYWPAAAWAERWTGKVVGVADGDTVTVLDAQHRRHRIRLLGIDAPEQNQAYGQKSKQSLSDQVFGHEVTIESTHRDRFDRWVGKLWLNDVDINLVQIQRGMAWHFKHYARDQPVADRASYDHAEQQARQARLGLWQDANPMPPWQFRRP